MQSGHAVDGHTAGDAEVGHPHLTAPENGHFFRFGRVVVEIFHLGLPAVGNLLHDLPYAGQQGFHQLLGPALQRFRQDGVVGVGYRVGGDVPRLVPAHPRLVHEDPHQLRDHQRGMGVVDLDHVLFVEVFQGAIGFQMLCDDGLHRSGDKEVLLLQSQGFALIVIVLRVEPVSYTHLTLPTTSRV